MKNIRRWIAVAAILMLAFIWGQSLLPVSVSAQESGWLMREVINPALESIGLRAVSHQEVRKAAHVLEFTALSLLISLLVKGNPLKTLLLGLIIAFFDETIQIFSQRGSQISDVWIDLIGVVQGMAIGWLAVWWHRKRSAAKAQAVSD